MSDFVMGAEMRLTDNVSQTFSAMTNSTNEFRSSIEPTERAVSSMTTAVSSGTQGIQNFADMLTETATATDSVVASTQQATQGTNKWKAAIQQFNSGTETLKNLPHTLKQVASQRLDGLQNSFISTRLQAGLLVGGVKALAREKVTTLVNNFKEFKNTVTESKGCLSGFATGLKNISKISIANTFNDVKNLTNKTKEFAATKLSGITNKFKEFKTRATGGETGVKGLWNATKNFASTSLTGIHNSIKKVGDLAVTAGKRVTQHLGGAFKSLGKGLGNLSVGMVKGFGVAVAGLGTAAIAASAGIFKLTNMASDLDETLNKVDVAFGESSSAVKAWSENSIKDMGLSKQTALDMASLFGDMGTSMGIPQKEAANMSTSLTQLGADLASFKNIKIEEATTALNGVFTGETESLKRLGIVMTQTNLDQFAMAKGIGKTTKEMTEAEKVNLRYAYVMEKTKNAQGDFARTGGGFANQLRQFKEIFKDIGTNIGKVFLPSLTKGIQTVNLFASEINDVFKDGWQDGDDKKLADIFTRMVDKGVSALSSGLPKVVNTIVPIVNTLTGAFLKALPSVVPVLLNGAITIFKSIIQMIQQNKQPLIDLAVSVITSLASFLLENIPEIILVGADLLLGLVQGLTQQLPQIITVAVQSIGNFVNGLLSRLPMIIQAALQLIQALVGGLINNLPTIIQAGIKLLVGLLQGIVSMLPSLIQMGLQLIRTLQQSIWSALPQIIQAGVQLLVSLIQGIVQSLPMLIQAAIDMVVNFIQTIISNLPAILQAAVQIVVALAVGLVQAIPQLVMAIPQLISAIIDTILSTNWLEVGWEIVKGIGKGLWGGVKSIFGGGGKEGGEAAANGAASGLTSNIGTINTASQTATNSITTGLQPDFTAINGYGVTATTGLATGLIDGATGLNTTAMQLGTDASTNIATGLTSGAETVNMAATQLGTNTVTGLSTGITDSIGLATDATNNTATVVTDTFKGIDLYDCGTNAMQGFVNGINAMRSTKAPKVEKREMNILSQDEIAQFLNTTTDYRYYAAYVLALSTGVRRGEVLGLSWNNVDLGIDWKTLDKALPWEHIGQLNLWDTDALAELLEVEHLNLGDPHIIITQQLSDLQDGPKLEIPKTTLSRRTIDLPYDMALVFIFQRSLQRKEKKDVSKGYNADDLVFCTSTGAYVPPRTFTRIFHSSLAHAGVKKVRFHDLRHTVATVLLEDGAPLNSVQELLGHYNAAFTATQYGHVTKKMKKETTDKLGNMLQAAKKKF